MKEQGILTCTRIFSRTRGIYSSQFVYSMSSMGRRGLVRWNDSFLISRQYFCLLFVFRDVCFHNPVFPCVLRSFLWSTSVSRDGCVALVVFGLFRSLFFCLVSLLFIAFSPCCCRFRFIFFDLSVFPDTVEVVSYTPIINHRGHWLLPFHSYFAQSTRFCFVDKTSRLEFGRVLVQDL